MVIARGEGPVALRREDQQRNEWRSAAACRGEEANAFFPPSTFERKELRIARERVAKSICRGCPVREECLTDAIEVGEPHGIWGGLNEIERRQFVEWVQAAGAARRTGSLN
jgi:WhiB family transcriptional regulator, redox-sensing transcriptional regulator